jgi:hypothetical protein
VDPVPDPLLFRNSGRVGNRTRTSGFVSRNSALDHRGSPYVDISIFFVCYVELVLNVLPRLSVTFSILNML